MSSYFKFLLLAILLPAISFAQSNFKPGYTVTLKGDTLKGEIDYKEWARNPESIRFKNSNNQVITCDIKNTKAFGIDKMDYYERFIMPISMGSVALANLSSGADTTRIIDTVFLRKLTTGKYLTLYDYNDELKMRYMIRDSKSAQPIELVYQVYSDTSNTSQLVEYKYYKTQLTRYAFVYNKVSPALSDRISRTNYDDDIIKIVNLINGANELKTAGKSRQGIRLFAGVSINSGQLKYSGDIGLATNPQNVSSYFPELNFGIDLFQNSNVGRLIFRAEISLYAASLTASSTSYIQGSVLGTDVQKLQQRSLALCPQIIYNIYNSNTAKVFIGAGVKVYASVYPKNTYTSTNVYDTHTSVRTNFPDMRKIGLNIPIKAGVTIYNKFEIYGRYGIPSSLTNNYLNFSGDITTMAVGFNYLFGTTR